MIDRCARCGWPLQGNLACCFGAGYWSQRAPLPADLAHYAAIHGELPLCVAGYHYYGNPDNALLRWSPEESRPPGIRDIRPLVLAIYQAHLSKAERNFGVRSLLHYEAFVQSIAWAEREINARHSEMPKL